MELGDVANDLWPEYVRCDGDFASVLVEDRIAGRTIGIADQPTIVLFRPGRIPGTCDS